MKTRWLLWLVPAIVLSVSCRKGNDDPFLSLMSRKARLANEWTLTGGTSEVTLSAHGKQILESYVLSGGNYQIELTDTNSLKWNYSGRYSLKISFGREGSFTMDERTDSTVLAASGEWDFTARLKGSKNKEHIMIKLSDVSRGYSGYYMLFTLGNTEFYYSIKELRKDKLVLTANGARILSRNGYDLTFRSELVFEPDK